ncbi:tail fiber protein [Flavobacterium sp.]|uniref:tail fiber protein n=1 Tax=Flavobacterium sp. TaxID=239 RepID=UPI0025BF400B|nr:tail fiber protein [Flavobacterium sp.]
MKKQILIGLVFLSSILSVNAQNWSGSTPGKIYYNSGNVGIGEINPDQKLNVTQSDDIVTSNQYRFPLKLVLNDNIGGLWQGTGVGMKFHLNASDANFDTAEIVSIAKTAGVSNGDLAFRTAKAGVLSTQLTIDSEGKVGIGEVNPDQKLNITQTEDILTSNQYRFPLKLVLNDNAGGLWQGTGVGMKFHINAADANFDTAEIVSIAKTAGASNGDLAFKTAKAGVLSTQLTINSDGKVGIGTDAPAYKLDVEGTIRASEIKVCMQGTCVPDFVFKKDYKLMSLNELEKFVTTQQHLPEIEPEKEMIENGLNMKDFQMKLLQKMEEMTLYIIEQNKKSEKQEQELKLLKAEIKKLKSAEK